MNKPSRLTVTWDPPWPASEKVASRVPAGTKLTIVWRRAHPVVLLVLLTLLLAVNLLFYVGVRHDADGPPGYFVLLMLLMDVPLCVLTAYYALSRVEVKATEEGFELRRCPFRRTVYSLQAEQMRGLSLRQYTAYVVTHGRRQSYSFWKIEADLEEGGSDTVLCNIENHERDRAWFVVCQLRRVLGLVG